MSADLQVADRIERLLSIFWQLTTSKVDDEFIIMMHKELSELLKESEALQADLSAAKAKLMRWEEREGMACPEDVKFEEVIEHWKKRTENAEAELDALLAKANSCGIKYCECNCESCRKHKPEDADGR